MKEFMKVESGDIVGARYLGDAYVRADQVLGIEPIRPIEAPPNAEMSQINTPDRVYVVLGSAGEIMKGLAKALRGPA